MFVGAFSAGLFKGECTTSSLQRATVASGLTCKFNGAQPSLVTPQLVESNSRGCRFREKLLDQTVYIRRRILMRDGCHFLHVAL